MLDHPDPNAWKGMQAATAWFVRLDLPRGAPRGSPFRASRSGQLRDLRRAEKDEMI